MRLFLAINLDAALQRDIVAATSTLRDAAPALGWGHADKLHLTLKFLGEQPDDAVPGLRKAIDTVAPAHRAFMMHFSGVGAFPNFRRARVIWLGISPEPRLELLHHDVEVECERAGFPIEGRPYRPHLTLARVRDDTKTDMLRDLAKAAKAIDFEAESPVSSIDLMRSELHGARGATYQMLHTARLRGS